MAVLSCDPRDQRLELLFVRGGSEYRDAELRSSVHQERENEHPLELTVDSQVQQVMEESVQEATGSFPPVPNRDRCERDGTREPRISVHEFSITIY